MKKKDFLSKLTVKNYNNELEKVLEDKNFSSNTKNLLLNMLYKIELGYKDYKSIKRTTITQNQIIEDIIEIVKTKCDKIELVEPNSKKGKVLSKYNMGSISNGKDKKIISYPIEKELLYAISNLETDNFKIAEKYYLVKATLPILLRIGNSINNKEIIRDFNGWSWDIEVKDIENFEYNIIYQNLRILLDSDFLYHWQKDNTNATDYIIRLRKILENKYGKNNMTEFYNLFILLSAIIVMYNNEDIKNRFMSDKLNIKNDIQLMMDKTKFLDKITKDKRKINSQIKEIDTLLNNSEFLEKELEKRNQRQRKTRLTISALETMLTNKRKNLLKKLEECFKLMDPKKYTANIDELEKKEKILESIDEYMISKEWIEENLIKLQIYFLNCIKTKIENTKIKADLIEIVYHFRYYKNICIKEGVKISEVNELENILKSIEDTLIIKGLNIKAINNFTKNVNFNIEIVKRVIASKIINIQNIEVELKAKYDKLQIYFYDKEVLEECYEIETGGAAEKVNAKTNKKLKIFL